MQDIEKVFEEVRWNFGLLPIGMEIINNREFVKLAGQSTIAGVSQHRVYFNRKYLDLAANIVDFAGDAKHFPGYHEEISASGRGFELALVQAVSEHEDGHPYLPYSAPGTFRNKLDDAKAVGEMMGDKKIVAVDSLLNIAYDMIIDVKSHDRIGYDPRPVLYTFAAEGRGQMPNDFVGQSLVAFREEMMGNHFSGYPIAQEVRDAVRIIVGIIRDADYDLKPRQRVLDISRILLDLYRNEPEDASTKSGRRGRKGRKYGPLTEDELKELAEAIREALKELGMNSESNTADDITDNPIEKKMAQVNLSDPDDREAAAKLLGLSEDEAAFLMLWQMAAERVRLQTPLTGLGEGTAYPAGHVPWFPGMPIRDLNIEATLATGGVFIPGITTLQDMVMPGPGFPVEGRFPRICINVDTSGSVQSESPLRPVYNHDLVLIALFAMIHEAKRRRVEVSVDLFADSHYSIEWNTDYEKTARKLFDNVRIPGSGNSVAGPEAKVKTWLKPGDLLVYITDFYLGESCCNLASELFQRFLANGIGIVFIAMFDHCADASGLPFVECKQLEDLEEIALTSIQTK